MMLWAGVIGSVVLNGLALLVGRGSFGHEFVVLVVAIYAGGAALFVAACAYPLRNRSLFARRLARGAALVAVVSASAPISLVPGRYLARRDIAAAKKRCESLIPQITEYRVAHGVYPRNISVAASDEVSGLARACAYASDGAHFSFTLGDPRTIMTFIGYESRTRQWSEWR